VTESEDADTPSPIAHLFTEAEEVELGELMLSFDGGMIDFGELDGFLSALAVAPQPSTLERWWSALLGPEPEWEADGEAERAKALIERYYAMVQARVAISPFDLGPDAVPPLWSMTEDDDFDDAEAGDLDDEAFDEDSIDPEILAALERASGVGSNPFGESPGAVDDLDDALDDDDDDDLDDDDEDGSELGELDEAEDGLTDEDLDFGEDGFDGTFAVAETWLSGFRYAISLQSADWRQVLEEEPKLARWLKALWEAADSLQGEEGPLDSLPAMAPSAAAPEDAGFLALEAVLRERSEGEPITELDEAQLIGLIPTLLHQLWRRHRDGAGSVADALEQDVATGMANQQFAIIEEVDRMLKQHALPSGGLSLEQLDGWWTAQRASGLDVSPFDHLERILGKDKVWDDAEEARQVMTALYAYWNAIGDRLQRKADPEDPLCYPYVEFPEEGEAEDHPERPYGREFARHFLAAIEDFPRSAKLLLMDPEAKHWLAPLECLAEGRSLEKRGGRLAFEERMAMIAELPDCIAGLASFWQASGGAGLRKPVRADALPGRNDPCPCGSGKKYKKCHGAPERLN
jgi:uncharacterized protein